MEDIKTQLANRLKESYNVLITVSRNPSIDQLSAAIGLALILNKLNKHATAVFSGAIPPVIEFLHPEKTIEKNTDSLRDFIISLDKSKADKLRYKIEDQFVKIYITPYHTSINEKDLVFSQGDFNVDVVVALGVHSKEELDSVITAHGRILHDATVSTVNTAQPSTLGSINWSNKNSSSLCEMVLYLSDGLGNSNVVDVQTANALLTGIVAETSRFSNQKTTSMTMSASSRLLAAGANQQLVATQLEAPKPKPEPPKPPQPAPLAVQPPAKPEDKDKDKGVIKIDHTDGKAKTEDASELEEDKSGLVQVQIDDQGTLKTLVPEQEKLEEPAKPVDGKPQITNEEAAITGQSRGAYMNAAPKNADDSFLSSMDNKDDEEGPAVNDATMPQPPLLSHDSEDTSDSSKGPIDGNTGDQAADSKTGTLQDSAQGPPDIDQLRNKVNSAIGSNPDQEFMAPIESLNAQPLGQPLNPVNTGPGDNNDATPDTKDSGDAAPPPSPTSPPPPPPHAPPVISPPNQGSPA